MENINTQPQAFYTKLPSSSNVFSENVLENIPTPKKKKNFKNILAIIGLLFFVAVASTGVIISQKQVAQKGEEIKPIAPNAPESKPKATTDDNNYCVTSFSIPKGSVVCDSKIAQSHFSGPDRYPFSYPDPGSFDIGDTFVFSITISATENTTEAIKVLDVLPKGLLFIDDPENTPGIIVATDAVTGYQSVMLDIDGMSKDETVKVEFMVEVVTQPESMLDTDSEFYFSATNSARIVTDNDISTLSECSYKFNVLDGGVECISKEMYDGDPADTNSKIVPAGSSLTRGEEYVYYISLSATNRSNGDVKLYDLIPDGLEFVRALDDSQQYITNEAGNNTILANLGVLENEDVKLGFVVKVIDDPEIGELTNSALVYVYPSNSEEAEPLETGSSCDVKHSILPAGTAQCIEKEAFEDFDGSEILANQKVSAGQEFVYKISIKADDVTTGDVVVVDELPKDLIFVEDSQNTDGIEYDSDTRQVSLDYGVIEDNEVRTIEFKVQVIANPSGDTLNNVATVTTNEETSHVCELPLKLNIEEEEYACNQSCETNANCQTVNDNYVCYTSGDNKVCRLDSNLDSSSCSPAATPTPTPAPTPAPGCNETCTSNANCSNSSHVCVTTADGTNKCRLEDYPESSICAVPLASVQPELPTVLPETGPEDWLNWLKAGLVTLGVGTALFLLL